MWDIRYPREPLLTRRPHAHGDLTSMITHRYVHNVIATGSSNNEVKLMNDEGKILREIRFHEGFLSQRIGPVTTLALHPKKHLLAVGCSNSVLSFFE